MNIQLYITYKDNFAKKYVKDGSSTKVYTRFNGQWLFVYRAF